MSPVRLGAHLRPPPPSPEPSPEEGVLARILARLEALAVPAPVVEVQRVSDEDIAQIVQSVVALAGPKPISESELAAAIVRNLPKPEAPSFPDIPQPVDLSPALNRLADRLTEQMNVLRGIASQSAQAFGSSGPANIADNPSRELGHVTVKNPTSDPATETTLATLAAEDFATQTTLAAILTELQSDPTFSVSHGTATISGTGGFQTVTAVTPATDVVVVGMNADATTLTDISYRYQLAVDGAAVVQESITVNRNSWIPLSLSVASGSTITVQADHSEVGDQDFRATINYRTL